MATRKGCAVLLSIRPEWCALIAGGKKTVEVRKTRPKLETPFKAYIYETSGDQRVGNENLNCLSGGGRR
jgi:predicted transcriptional regulator